MKVQALWSAILVFWIASGFISCPFVGLGKSQSPMPWGHTKTPRKIEAQVKTLWLPTEFPGFWRLPYHMPPFISKGKSLPLFSYIGISPPSNRLRNRLSQQITASMCDKEGKCGQETYCSSKGFPTTITRVKMSWKKFERACHCYFNALVLVDTNSTACLWKPLSRWISPFPIKIIKERRLKKEESKDGRGRKGSNFLVPYYVPDPVMGTFSYVIYLFPTIAQWSQYSYLTNFR